MRSGAHTPEELETLLEDAFVMRDPLAVRRLVTSGAVLAAGYPEVFGAERIAHVAEALWEHHHTYVAEPQRVLQTRHTALLVAEHGINVARRQADGCWRYEILLLETSESERNEP
jgi:hypothetical protein